MTIGDRIKKRRLELNIQPDEIAEAIGKSRATIYRYEGGYVEDIPIGILKKIADILQTSPTYLMGLDEEEEPKKDNVRISLVARGMSDMTEEQQKRFCDMARAAFPDIFGSEDALQ